MAAARRQTKRQRRRARETQHDLRVTAKATCPFKTASASSQLRIPIRAPLVWLLTAISMSAPGLEPARRNDGTVAEGAPGWTPPKRPLVTVITALRDDALGRMFARRQIGQPQYLAGRAYQECADRATLGSVRSIDLSKTKVSGGALPDMLTEAKQKAMARLRMVEQRPPLRRRRPERMPGGLERASISRSDCPGTRRSIGSWR